MKRQIYLSILFVFLGCSLVKAEVVSLSLDEAMAMALSENRDILLKTEDVAKAKLKIAEAKGALLPSVTFTGTWSDTLGYYAKAASSITTQTSVKQYLYKGGKTINTIKYNEHNREASAALLDKTMIETVLGVKKAYYTLILATHYANLNRKILKNAEEHFYVIQERYKNGQASESDVLTLKASLNSLKQAYEASLNQVESAQEILKNLLFLADDVRVQTTDQLSYEDVELLYEEVLLEALKKRPEIRQYEAQSKAAENSIEMVRVDHRPSIYASWDYYSRNTSGSTVAPARGWQDYNVLGVTFSWPIFDGWVTRAKVEQAIVDLKEAQLMKEKLYGDIRVELKNAYLSFKDAISKLKASEADIEVYKNNLTEVKAKHQKGITSALDLEDARLKYDVSLFNRTQAIYDFRLAQSQFDKARGEF